MQILVSAPEFNARRMRYILSKQTTVVTACRRCLWLIYSLTTFSRHCHAYDAHATTQNEQRQKENEIVREDKRILLEKRRSQRLMHEATRLER